MSGTAIQPCVAADGKNAGLLSTATNRRAYGVIERHALCKPSI